MRCSSGNGLRHATGIGALPVSRLAQRFRCGTAKGDLYASRGRTINTRPTKSVKFRHVVPQEIFGGRHRHLSAVGYEAGGELDVGLRAFIWGELQKAEHAAQALLRDGRAIAPGDVPIRADALRVNEFLP
jgi:hypothetical protein